MFSLADGSDLGPWARAQAALVAACAPPVQGARAKRPAPRRGGFTRLLTNVARTLRPTALWLPFESDRLAAWLVYYTALREKSSPTILTIGGVEQVLLAITVRAQDNVVARFDTCLAEVIAGTPLLKGSCTSLPPDSVKLPLHVRYRQGDQILNRLGSPWNMMSAEAILDPPCPITAGKRSCNPGQGRRLLEQLYLLGQQPAFTYVTRLLPFFPPTAG
jgi:hypothetical protein